MNCFYIMYNLTKNKSGFTLVELLVSIAILMIMSSMVLVDYNISGRNSALLLEAHKFAGDARRAQNMAIGSSELESTGSVPIGGWGIYILNDHTYYIFADNGNEEYDVGDIIFETIILENNVVFSSTSVNKDIVYLPPDPRTFINGKTITNTSQDSEITIVFASVAGIKNVYLNDLGLIDIEN